MEPSRRFIKRIPPSGVAPAFKLSLPQNIVYAHLGHWVGRPFEMAATENSEQSWTGSILPRRNKERAEFTLKGWRLFAEAHGIRTGDQYSFEIVSKSRLVISLLAGNNHVGNVSPPPPQPDPARCGAVATQRWAAGQLGRPDSELSLSMSRSSFESQLSDAQAAQAAMLLDEAMEPSTTGALVEPQSVPSPMVLECGQDLHGADKSRESHTPTSSSAANQMLQAGFQRGGVAYSQKECLNPSSPSSGSILSCLDFDPLMPVPTPGSDPADPLQAMHSNAADEPVDWLVGLGGDAAIPPSWLQRSSPTLVGNPASAPGVGTECKLKRLRSDCKPEADITKAGPVKMKRMQAGVNHAQVQAHQAGKAELDRLKHFMLETRDSQQGMLNAVAMLERLSNRLVSHSASSNPSSCGSTVQDIQAEMLGCMETIKSGIWKFLSTDV